jgi:Fe-S-cluster-containing dehydrogenase component
VAKAIVVDLRKCYACLGCVVECAYHRAGAGPEVPLLSGILSRAACEVVAVGTEPVPLFCHQCENAPCVLVCPTGAMASDEANGVVISDAAKCIGCKACVIACPFGMVDLNPDGKTVVKCDLCADRVAKGLSPVCVGSCPTGAIELRELDDVIRDARARAAEAYLAERSSR